MFRALPLQSPLRPEQWKGIVGSPRFLKTASSLLNLTAFFTATTRPSFRDRSAAFTTMSCHAIARRILKSQILEFEIGDRRVPRKSETNSPIGGAPEISVSVSSVLSRDQGSPYPPQLEAPAPNEPTGRPIRIHNSLNKPDLSQGQEPTLRLPPRAELTPIGFFSGFPSRPPCAYTARPALHCSGKCRRLKSRSQISPRQK